MQLLEHYARLYALWKDRAAEGPSFIEITLPELAVCFHCTERNTKLLIKAMQHREWLLWQPGRGRGHRSRLCCTAVPDLLLISYAQELLQSGEVQEAAKLLHFPWLSIEGKGELLQVIRRSFDSLAPISEEDGRHHRTLRFPTYRQPGMLDPAMATRRTELHWIRQMFDTLVLYDVEQAVYLPGLAHAWESDQARRTWRFYLQKHVQFHNGAAFSAEDVRFTLERLASFKATARPAVLSPYRGLFAGLESILCMHDHAIEIRWKESFSHCLSLLTLTAASIVPSALPPDWPYKVVGTGPFRMSKREDRLWVLKANPSYYRKPSNLDQVEMWCLPEIYDQGMFKELGEQEAEGMNFGHTWGGQGSEKPWERLECIDRGCKYVLINQAKPGLLQRRSMRELVYEVIQQKDAGKELGGNRGERAERFVKELQQQSASMSCKPEWLERMPSLPDQEFSTSKSIDGSSPLSIETEGGASSTTSTQMLQLVTYAGAGHEKDAEWLKRELGNKGVPVQVHLVDYNALHHPDTLAMADLYLLEQPVDADEEAVMWAILASNQSPLRSCLPQQRLHQLDGHLARLALEPLRSERLQGLIQLEQELLEDRSVVLWYRWRHLASYPSGLQGVKISPLGWVDYKDLWFKE